MSNYTIGQVYEVDPATLLIGTNVRADVRQSREFTASIKAQGVLEPITAWVDEDGQLVVYRGQRRTVTACQVGTPSGTVPVRVVERPDEADRIVTQVSENVHRAAMHAAEERDAIEQLALLGVSAAQIAKRTALHRQTVDAALTVAGSTTAKERMDEAGLTLPQAAALAEFEDDPAALEALETAIRYRHNLDHAVQRERDRRAARAVLQGEAERLRAEGLPTLDVADYPAAIWSLRLSSLVREQDHQPVPEEDWPTIPGAAVIIERDYVWPDEDEDGEVEDLDDEAAPEPVERLVPVWICLDPEAAGLVERYSARASTPDQPEDEAAREAKRAERRRVIENNKAWRSAETVRRQWLAQFVTRKTPPKDAEAFICKVLVTGPHWLRQALENGHSLLRSLTTGKEAESRWGAEGEQQVRELATSPATAKAHTMRTVALILAAWEDSTGVQTWRGPTADDALVMGHLVAWGYEASDVEQLLLTQDQADDDEADPAA